MAFVVSATALIGRALDVAQESKDIAAFDQMGPAAQSEILKRKAIQLSCITGYRSRLSDEDVRYYEPVRTDYYYDNLSDLQAARSNPKCIVITNHLPRGPGN